MSWIANPSLVCSLCVRSKDEKSKAISDTFNDITLAMYEMGDDDTTLCYNGTRGKEACQQMNSIRLIPWKDYEQTYSSKCANMV